MGASQAEVMPHQVYAPVPSRRYTCRSISMAPTICFSEKTVLGVELRNGRRLRKMGVALAKAKAAGVAQNSAVLRYVANGSMNSTFRWKRRRGVRMTPRLPQNAKRVASGSASAANGHVAEIISEQTKHLKRMEFNYNKMRSQLVCTHSSSSSTNKHFNIKTVLQPTTANNNCSNSCGNNKTATAKFCDHSSGMDDNDDDDEEKDRGYVFVREPIRQPQMQQEQQIPKYRPHNDGLLSIALKTINLVQRNEILQKRLTQLQLETSEFIASVLANPENRHFRERITANTKAANIESNVLRH